MQQAFTVFLKATPAQVSLWPLEPYNQYICRTGVPAQESVLLSLVLCRAITGGSCHSKQSLLHAYSL